MYYVCQYFSFILNAASDNFVVYHNLFSVYFVRNVQDAVSSFPQDKKPARSLPKKILFPRSFGQMTSGAALSVL